MTFTDYLKDQFIKTGECIKDNFEDLYPAWKNELDDDELNKFANEWTNKQSEKLIEVAGEAIKELQIIKGLAELSK